MGYAGYSAVNFVALGFPGTLRCAWVVNKMFLRLVLVDLVDLVIHVANSISVQHVATLETDFLCGEAPPSSSCIPLSQCKSQAVCCREQLRVIVFDKNCNPLF